jgi:predicted CoA-substrate-specific enzyme activase
MSASLTIHIPVWLDFIFTLPLLAFRLLRYGYTFRRIPLGEGIFALVSPLDFYRLNKFHWYAEIKKEHIYAARNVITSGKKKIIFAMHREIMNFPSGLLVDHKNGNTLDNRRANLRIATRLQNNCNRRKTKSKTSSRFIGVCFHKSQKRWCANIRHNGKKLWLGSFVSEIDAARAYDAAALKYHGQFARLNFPEDASSPEHCRRTRLNFPEKLAPQFIGGLPACKKSKIRYTVMATFVALLLTTGEMFMEEQKHAVSQSQKTAAGQGVEPLRSEGKSGLYLGIDIGSISSDVVVLDANNRIVLSDYRRTKGKPIETLHAQLRDIFAKIKPADIHKIAATGSAARLPAKILGIPFVNEVAAQAAAVSHLYPDIEKATVIEMGGQDSKLIFLHTVDGVRQVRDFALNTVCAAGTGSFLDQQADRLGINIEDEFGRLALQSKNVPRMAGRCSVFAKSDMIHLQQQATPVHDILAGLCLALARNLKSNLGCGREFTKPIIFTGGVAANAGVVRAIREIFEIIDTKADGDFLVPEVHFFTGAIGALLVSKSKSQDNQPASGLIEKIDLYISRQGTELQNAPRREPLTSTVLPPPRNYVHSELLDQAIEPIEAYLGVDVGSLSTKAVVMDKQKRILAKIYLMTAGRPLDAIGQVMQSIGRQVKNKVVIAGAASTGSGRYLTGDFIGADVVINEITAQATGASIVNPKVDTIFEIGGQDSKYISLNNGVVVDFEMNHACAAGTGSFLEEQAQRLGISIKEEFAKLAFASKSPIKLGERCTVFIETDLLSYQQQGASTEDLVAGLSYSIVANYLNRVVGRRKIGDNICFQGGTAFNHAVWAAFEKVVGKPVQVPDHHEVTGALGAAAIAAEHINAIEKETGARPASKFKGFENLVNAKYTVETFECEHCSNHCEIKKVQMALSLSNGMADSDPLYYGSRCDRYNLKKKGERSSRFNAFKYRQEKLFEFAGLNPQSSSAKPTEDRSAIGTRSETQGSLRNRQSKTVGIPLALANWQLLPLFSQFFRELGFDVVFSSRTTKEIIRRGVESATAQPCFPVKVANGHIAQLIEKGVDYIFLPSIVSSPASFPENKNNHFCPYVQSFPYQVQSAFGDKLGKSKLLITTLRLGEGDKLARKTFDELGKIINVPVPDIRRAMAKGFEAQDGFDQALREKGREILDAIKQDPSTSLRAGEKLFVLVSRPYNGCDDGVSLELPKKFIEAGIEAIPIDMLDFTQAQLGDEKLHSDMYWGYGQKILRAAEIIKRDPRLFAIYLSNFSCGPDSFLMPFFKDIMGDKPCLQLEIDEHSADAGVVTRIEAFLESLKNYGGQKTEDRKQKAEERRQKADIGKRTLYVPYMSDASYGLAACLRSYGQSAEVMPMADEPALMAGRAFTTGKECLPCAITAGEMLKVLGRDGNKPEDAAFFMPSTSGPCRFGMYHCMHDMVLRYAGLEEALLIAPNQDSNFYSELAQSFGNVSLSAFMKDVWTAVVGIDLLQKLILRIRPYAAEPKEAQWVYEGCLSRWTRAVETKWGLEEMTELMGEIAKEFWKIKIDYSVRKPRIGIVGEIYVRNHRFANRDIIGKLEELGAACDLASLAEWIYYTNFTRAKMARRRGQFKNLFTNALQDYFQHKIERALARPLEAKFGRLAEHKIDHVINLAKPYIDESFEGEAILSVGKIVEYHEEGFGGVVNVMPFTCMPSTIVSTQTRRLSGDCGELPILNLSFDGQEDVTLTTRLEAFVEQVAARQRVSIAELV